jgi:hypothetical protein
VKVPVGVIRPIVLREDSVNQRFPSGPVTIVYGRLLACGSGNSVTEVSGTEASDEPGRPTSGSRRINGTSVETIHGLSNGVLPSRSVSVES